MDNPAFWATLISSVVTLVGTFGGILTASKLSNYRIEQLEKKVDKHNSIMEKTYGLETNQKEMSKDLESLGRDHESLKQEVHKIDTRVAVLEKGRG